MDNIDKVFVCGIVMLLGFLMIIFGIFIKQKEALIAKHQQNIETIEVLEKRIELIEEQLEFTYWLLPDGKKNEKQTNREKK